MTSTSITDIEAQIVAKMGEITGIKKSYDYPVLDIGRKVPCLIILYDGFSQEPEAALTTSVTWRWKLTLCYALESALKNRWADLKDLVPEILDKFRANPGLGGTCWYAELKAGEAVIHVPADPSEGPRWFGHEFTVEVTTEEA